MDSMSTFDQPQGPRYDSPSLPVPSLVDAYRATDFVVKTTEAIVLRVDTPVPQLTQWLTTQRCETAAVITAWNPFSQSLSKKENARRNQELRAAIEANDLRSAPAAGCARSGNWDSEESFCVFNATGEVIDGWMQRFGQYAVVIADKQGIIRLLWHPSIRSAMAAREAR